MIKLALIGRKQSGKTFVAQYLRKQHHFTRLRMDDIVAKFIRDVYGYSTYQRPTWELRYDIYNELYKLDNTMFTKYLFTRMKRITKDVVVEDVRYVSELKELHDNGFNIIRIVAPEGRRRRHIGKQLRNSAKGSIYVAEAFYDDKTAEYSADYVVLNETRDNTRENILKILDELRSKSI